MRAWQTVKPGRPKDVLALNEDLPAPEPYPGTVVGVIPSHYDRAFKELAQERIFDWWREGRLQTHIEELVPFEDLLDALERIAASTVRGKLALQVHPDATAPSEPAVELGSPRV